MSPAPESSLTNSTPNLDSPSPSSSTNPTTTGPDAESPSPSSSPTPVAAIAGGVIGGVAALALAAAAAWLFLRRRKRTADAALVPGTDPDEPAPGYYAAASAPHKDGYELTGSKFVPLELNSNRDHAELGGSPLFYAGPPVGEPVTGPVEMDATLPGRHH